MLDNKRGRPAIIVTNIAPTKIKARIRFAYPRFIKTPFFLTQFDENQNSF